MKRHKILLVDESEISRYYFRDAFWLHEHQDEYDISFARGADEAEKVLREMPPPEIIFLDPVMHVSHRGRSVLDPEGGLKLLAQVRSRPELKAATMVIFSTAAHFNLWKKAKQLGADFFLKKDNHLPHHLVAWTEDMLYKKQLKLK